MNDEKRQIRDLKRQIKKQGNRKRRRFLKNLSTDPRDFDFRGDCSETMNERRDGNDRSQES